MSEVILSSSAIDLLLRALPVSSADDLLAALVTAWQRETAAESLFVSLVHDRYLIGLFCDGEDGAPSIPVSSRVDGECWSAAVALDTVARMSGGARSLSALDVVEFEFDQQLIGGVLCFAPFREERRDASLAEVSARLVAQLRASGDSCDSIEQRRRKLEALAEFAAGAGHEINNPVATIAGRASLLLRGEVDPERRRALETIGGQAYRIRDMIGDAMTTARPPAPLKARFTGADVIHDVLARFEVLIAGVGAAVSVELDESLGVLADRDQFAVVVSALVRNALEALERADSDRSLHIHWQRGTGLTGDSVAVLSIEDDGPGLSDIEREHLFDPFFSGRQAGRGLGFGLTKCWRIVEAHGGQITHRDVEPHGLRIDVEWHEYGPTGQ